MNAISLPGAPAWFNFILNLSAQASVLAALVWVVLKIFGRWIPPAWRALIWFLVIARVLIPFSPASSLSLHAFLSNSLARLSAAPAQEPPAAPIRYTVTITNLPDGSQFTTRTPIFPEAVQIAEPPAFEVAPLPIGRPLALGWTIGAIFFLALLVARSIIIRQSLLRDASPPPNEILDLFSDCRAAMRILVPVRLTASNQIAAPALTGLVPPRLIIPKNFGPPNYTAAQTRQILRHELAHVQQGHLFLHWLSLLARAIHWFNPAIHFAAAQLRQQCELAADAAALKNATPEERTAYGETILQVLSQSTAPPTVLALGMAEQARHLKARMRAVASLSKSDFNCVGVVVAAAIFATGLTGAPQREQPNPPITAGMIATNKSMARYTTREKNLISMSVSSPAPNLANAHNSKSEPLYTRTFKIDRNTFQNGTNSVDTSIDLSQIANLPRSTSMGVLQHRVREFFIAAGVDFPPNNVVTADRDADRMSQKAIFFNDLTGALFVRATARDLEIIEHALHTLNAAPPQQVAISVQIFDLPNTTAARIKTNFVASPLTATNEFIFASIDVTNPPAPLLPPTKVLVDGIKSKLIETNITFASNFVTAADAAATLATELRSTTGVEALAMPVITTVVGRQARISLEETRSVMTAESRHTGGLKLPFGWTIDCFPESEQTGSLRLTTTAVSTEFLGYEKDGDTPLPRFHVRGTGSTVTLPSGSSQGFFLPAKTLTRVPLLSDIPHLGELFQNQDESRHILILVTPTLIDGAGNPIQLKGP